MSGLRDLDDRVVPRAAARVRALVDGSAARRRAVGRSVRDAVVGVADPSGPLARLDDRFAGTPPLRLVRSTPAAGVAVVLAVLLAGAGVAVARSGDGGPASGGSEQQAARVLGPSVGDSVETYLSTSRARAAEQSQARPDAVHVALVSLEVPLTPDAAQSLLTGVEVSRAYLRVESVQPSEVLSADVGDLVGDLRALYAATAERKAADAAEFLRLARSLPATTAEQRRFRDFYELSAQLARREGEAYGAGCACVFAVVVRATAADLAELPALQGVRGVQLAPAGVPLAELRVQPLVPGQTGRVGPAAAPRAGTPSAGTGR